MQPIDVSVEIEESGVCVVKLQRSDLELNLRGSAIDFVRLSELGSADWKQRQSIRAGTCLGSHAWWSSNDKATSLLIGIDDESWDIAAELPTGTGDLIVNQIRSDLVVLVRRIEQVDYPTEAEHDAELATFEAAVVNPRARDLIYWPNTVDGFDEPHSAERVVEFALAYRPIEL